MTQQESFKRRIRVRMEKTGERYAAARRALVDKSESRAGRTWISEPEFSDEAITDATGRGWDEWCDLIERWPGHVDGHAAIAKHLREEHGVDGWWSQGVTVSYERIVGLRLPYQRADGTFVASKSLTVAVDVGTLRDLLLDESSRADLFPGETTTLRSKPSSKSIRLGFTIGVALITLDEAANGRCKVVVDHEKLPAFEDVAEWKFYWNDWLEALEDG